MNYLTGTLLGCCLFGNWAAAAEDYLSRFQTTIPQMRSRLPAIAKSAEEAAVEFVAGGKLWAAGPQQDFISEACGRAGGLMAMTPLGQQAPTNHDVILFAAPGRFDESGAKTIEQWQKDGAMVIRFVSPADLFENHFPIDTVANVLELWTWTGEFVAACTRLGKMPVLYLSYGLPGGPERGKKYQGKRFHDDLNIEPIAGGKLGRAYLDQIDAALKSVRRVQMTRLRKAAAWWREVPDTGATTLIIGHMFPRHMQDPRAPRLCDFVVVPPWEDNNLLETAHGSQFVLYLGYQAAPQKLVDQAALAGVKLVYVDVQPARTAEPAKNILYINPGWPRTDACVTVPGYDIPILPASGVIQSAIYWTLVSERAKAKL